MIAEDYKRMLERLCSSPKIELFDIESSKITSSSGVYIIYNKKTDNIMYVGESKNLRQRILKNHIQGNVHGSVFRGAVKELHKFDNEDEITKFIKANCSIQLEEIKNARDRMLFEHFSIAVLNPPYNKPYV